ncbi:MAG: SCP-like extracellular [Hyphomicrobiales bacterium]|nr:SCP-like extracellular [Hyphomicrobiales bacterium]
MKSLLACAAMLTMLALPAQAKPVRVAAAEDGGAAAMVSRFRASHGLGPVRIDPALTRAAREQAHAMASAGVLSHDVGGAFSSRMNAAGLGYVPTAENVGAGHRSLQAAIASWERSPGHQANLLMSSATRIGVARVDAPGKPYGVYWAMVLAADSGSGRAASGGGGFIPIILPFGIGFIATR